MLLFKVLFAVVALTVGLIVFNNIYGDNFLFSAVKSRVTATSEKSFSAKKMHMRRIAYHRNISEISISKLKYLPDFAVVWMMEKMQSAKVKH